MARQVNEGSCPWPRNSRAVSAWYAWHLLACPEVALHRHTRCRNLDQTYDLLAVLFDFRHAGVINDRWEYALSLCARAEIGADGSDGERRQVCKLQASMFRSLIARTRTGSTAGAIGMSAARSMHHSALQHGTLVGRVLTEAMPNNALPETSQEVLRSEPDAVGRITVVLMQTVGNTRYFDAAGYPGRTLGLPAAMR